MSGRDLIVHRDVLRQVAACLARMAGELQSTLSACAGAAAPAAGAAGSWPQAQQLGQAMARAHAGVTQFTAQLQQAHTDMAARLATSADRYDAAEQQITSLIHAAADPSAMIIGSGGQDTPVQPGYGQNWTPQQRAAYYRVQRLENMPGNSGPSWTGTYPITEDTDFSPGSAAGYTWEQVKGLVEATDPGAISAAGAAYGELALTLTDISSQLAGHGQTLAANWGGSTAVTAVSQVQQLYQTAADLQANTWAAQQALAWYGPALSTFRASLPQPATSHPADVQAANEAAQQRMSALNSHMETAFYQMPGAVNKNLPPALAGSGGGAGGSGGTAAGGPGTGERPSRQRRLRRRCRPGGHSAGARVPGPAGAPTLGAPPHLASGSGADPGTTLAGLTPTAPGGAGPGGAGTGGAGTAAWAWAAARAWAVSRRRVARGILPPVPRGGSGVTRPGPGPGREVRGKGPRRKPGPVATPHRERPGAACRAACSAPSPGPTSQPRRAGSGRASPAWPVNPGRGWPASPPRDRRGRPRRPG